jgi:hypothetical protein
VEIGSYEELKDVAKRLVTLTYDAQAPSVLGLEENHHPTGGFSMVTLTDTSKRLFTVTVFPNAAILVREDTDDTEQ